MEKSNKKSIIRLAGTVISWILTVFFALMALGISGIAAKFLFLICAILPCPLFRKHVPIPKKAWIPAVVVLFFVACVVSPAAKSATQEPPGDAVQAAVTPGAEEEPSEPEETTAPVESEQTQEQETPSAEPEDDLQSDTQIEPEAISDEPEEQKVQEEVTTKSPESEIPVDSEPEQTDKAPEPEQPAAPEEAVAAVDEEEEVEVIVYITDTGTKYHRGSCRHLKKSKIETTLEKAKAQGYEPCGTCDPPA